MGSALLRCLRCLSLKPTFNIGAISSVVSSSSGSRLMKSTIGSGSWSKLSLTEGKPDEFPIKGGRDEGEEGDRDKSKAFLGGQGMDFFLEGERAVKLVAGRLLLSACLRVPSWHFFSL